MEHPDPYDELGGKLDFNDHECTNCDEPTFPIHNTVLELISCEQDKHRAKLIKTFKTKTSTALVYARPPCSEECKEICESCNNDVRYYMIFPAYTETDHRHLHIISNKKHIDCVNIDNDGYIIQNRCLLKDGPFTIESLKGSSPEQFMKPMIISGTRKLNAVFQSWYITPGRPIHNGKKMKNWISTEAVFCKDGEIFFLHSPYSDGKGVKIHIINNNRIVDTDFVTWSEIGIPVR